MWQNVYPNNNGQNNQSGGSGQGGGNTAEINSYKSRISDLERDLSKKANINGNTYNEIKKLVDELVKKAESNAEYKETARQAQSLLEKFMDKENEKLKGMSPTDRRNYIKNNVNIQNPSQDVIRAEVKKILDKLPGFKKLGISTEKFQLFVYAMIQKESSWRHSRESGDEDHKTGAKFIPGQIVFGSGSGAKNNDIGLCQINDNAHSGLDYSRLARDWSYNLEQGINILSDAYAAAVRFLNSKNLPRSAENLAIATYSAYNGGEGNVGRSFIITNGNETEVHENDSVYLDYFKDYAKKLGIPLWQNSI